MGKEIDAVVDSPFERLQTHKSSSFPFAKLRLPTGQNQYGYRIKFVQDIKIVPNTRYPNQDGSPKDELIGAVEFLEVWNDDKITKGSKNRLNLSRHSTCESLFVDNFKAIKEKNDNTGVMEVVGYEAADKALDIMIQGKVKGAKSEYYAYAILPVEGELYMGALLGILDADDVSLFGETEE